MARSSGPPVADAHRAAEDAALARAVELARTAAGDTDPNPLAGAVVLREGAVLAEGHHAHFGGPHAEVVALRRAGAAARGATLCITLEPCSSTGKTPPCTEAVVAAGIRRVVVGAIDPDPRHRGAGLARLAAHGVDAELRDAPACRALLHRFACQLALRRPHVVAKWATSRDGAVAPADRRRVQLSGPAARERLALWRAHLDAIIVGVGTVLADDPLLTARGVPPVRPLRRVVLDPRWRTPPGSRLVTTAREVPTWIAGAGAVDERGASGTQRVVPPAGGGDGADRRAALAAAGVRLVETRAGGGDDPGALLRAVLAALWDDGARRVMLEGGAATLRLALAAGLVDQVAVFVCPVELGPGAIAPLPDLARAGGDPARIAAALGLTEWWTEPLGDDVLVRGYRAAASDAAR